MVGPRSKRAVRRRAYLQATSRQSRSRVRGDEEVTEPWSRSRRWRRRTLCCVTFHMCRRSTLRSKGGLRQEETVIKSRLMQWILRQCFTRNM